MDMRKLLLAAGLCLVAVVLAPVAAASAEEHQYAGACTFYGEANFGGAHLSTNPVKLTYLPFHFTSGPGGLPGVPHNECISNAGIGTKVVKAKVDGAGYLACGVSQDFIEGFPIVSVAGELSGNVTELKIEDANSVVHTVKGKPTFKFASAGGLLPFVVSGEGTLAQGLATFLTNSENLKECTSPEGASKLTFEAGAKGVFATEN
jgi:hypothetical protein